MVVLSLLRKAHAHQSRNYRLTRTGVARPLLLVLSLGLFPVIQANEPAHAAPSACTVAFPGYTAGLTTVNGGAYDALTNPYKISTEEELVYLSWATSSANLDSTNASASPPTISRANALARSYKQTEDIDLMSCLWTPIGENQHIFNDSNGRFSGVFDGGSKVIRNLKIEVNAGLAGFVGLAFKADLKNLRLIDVDITNNGGDGTSRYAGTGGLAGAIYDTTKISNTRVTGRIQSIAYPTGGLVGEIQRTAGATISRSSADVTASSSNPLGRVGGLVGVVDVASTISTSFATGSVTALNRVGGLVGTAAGNIDNSYASSSVTATAASGDGVAGGLVGEKRAATTAVFTNSYAKGEVNGRSPIGGLLGAIAGGSVTATATFWDTEGTGLPSSAVGEAKSATQMKSFDTFGPTGAGWDITEGWVAFDSAASPPQIWGICSGSTHPFLLWQYSEDPCAVPSEVPSGVAPRTLLAPAIHLDVQSDVGDVVAGSRVLIEGEGLKSGSNYSLVVRSTPMTLQSGTVPSSGRFSQFVTIPGGIAPGEHTITLSAVGAGGEVLVLRQPFVVGPDGTFVSFGPVASSDVATLAATGVSEERGLGMSGAAFIAMTLGVMLLALRRRLIHE